MTKIQPDDMDNAIVKKIEKLTTINYKLSCNIENMYEELKKQNNSVLALHDEIHLLRKENQSLNEIVSNSLNIAGDLLNLIDRANDHSENYKPEVINCLAQIDKEICKKIKKIGVSVIDSVDEKLDISIHEPVAVLGEKTTEEYRVDKIVERGFIYAGRVVKKAKVTCYNNKQGDKE